MRIGVKRGEARVEKYNSCWPELFNKEHRKFEVIFPGAHIVHIGSTSVPGMLAKPIIDILLGYKSDQEFENYKTYLVANGYRYRGCPHEIGDHIFIFVSENDIQTHKVHMVEFLGDLWKEKIKFRDILRKNKSVCERYSQFKKELASQYGHSRKEYTRRKGHLIEEILKQR